MRKYTYGEIYRRLLVCIFSKGDAAESECDECGES